MPAAEFILVYIHIIILVVAMSIIVSKVDNKRFDWKVHDLEFYIKYFNMDSYIFTYKNTKFDIKVEHAHNIDKCFETTNVIINNEKAVTIHSLKHDITKSRKIVFNHNRDEYEVRKIIHVARKNLYKKYRSKFTTSLDDKSYFKD